MCKDRSVTVLFFLSVIVKCKIPKYTTFGLQRWPSK